MKRPSLATVVAVLALVVALGSSSHAAGLLTGKQIKNESITGRDVTKLTGADLDEKSLDTVPRAGHASTADTAATVGDLQTDHLLTSDGCRAGTVRGTASVLGVGSDMPATYTSSTQFVRSVHNCRGGAVLVRRESAGHYFVKFHGDPADLAVVQIGWDPEPVPYCAVLDKVPVGLGVDSNAFHVVTFECSGSVASDINFALVLT